jgi:hypothetical protein
MRWLPVSAKVSRPLLVREAVRGESSEALAAGPLSPAKV